MTRENRRYRRESMPAEVFYKNEKTHSTGGCIAKNVSEGGVCIKVKEFFPIGTVIDLQFKLPLSETAFNVKGKVMWINKSPYNELWEAGIEIQGDRQFPKLVQRYIYLKNPDAANDQEHPEE